MFNYYETNGWKQGRSSKQIVSWQSAANNWILNCKRGTFAAATTEKQTSTVNTPALPASKPGSQSRKLNPAQTSINYLFERYIEAPENCTIISIEATYYNDIVKANIYDPSPDDKEQFKTLATSYLTNLGKVITEENKTNIAKKYAVLEFFKILNGQGKTTVF